MYPSASSRAATTAMFQAMGYDGRALHVYAMETFGVRNATLRLGTSLHTRAALGTGAALELDGDRLPAPVAYHAAASQILPPVPASPGPFASRRVVELSVFDHVAPSRPRASRPTQRGHPLRSQAARAFLCKRDAREMSTGTARRAVLGAHSGPLRVGRRCEAIGLVPLEMSCDRIFRSHDGAPMKGGRSPYLMQRRDAVRCCARAYIRLYLGPLPPSRGVQRGPSTSVALQSMPFGALTRSPPSTRSYTPAGHMHA